ncbi:DUF427 domain-containing protein [Solirubrobacter soli]|uniref:DUF427 domain-containing protein n=1 Tax=Solirubrobacter soli TaxID=363832 RepID=UPI0004839243|nr:DUF427 domain-containing protein [Solirubrobacter soli]
MSTRMRDLLGGALDQLRYEPTEKRVRALLGADTAVDSTRALLVWEPRRVVPTYAVPEADILAAVTPAPAADATADGILHPGIPFTTHTASGEPLTIGGREHAGFRLSDLAGHVALDFRAFDAWYEEDEPIRGHPRDPYSRVDVRETSRPVRIELDGVVLAETTRARLLYETQISTRFYLPREDVKVELAPSDLRTYCPYKGEASYFSFAGGENLVWCYEDPLPDAREITGLVAFWDERVDVYLDGELRPRPGGEVAEAMKDEFGL